MISHSPRVMLMAITVLFGLVIVLAPSLTTRNTAAESIPASRTATATRTPRPTHTPTSTPTPSSTPLPAKGQLYEIRWAPDSSALYVFSSAGLWRYPVSGWYQPRLSVPFAAAFGSVQSGGLLTTAYAIADELIATVGPDHVIRLWNPGSGTLINTLPALDADVNSLLISPDRTLLLASLRTSEGAIQVWDLSTSLLLTTLPGDLSTTSGDNPSDSIAFSADSQTLIYTQRDGQIVEWLRPANLIRPTGQQGRFVASADGSLLAVPNNPGNGSSSVTIFDVQANAPRSMLHSADPFTLMTFSADNKLLCVRSDQHFWHWSLPDSGPSISIRLAAIRDAEGTLIYSPARNLLAHVSQFGWLSEADPFLEVRVQNLIDGTSYQARTQVTTWGEQQLTPAAFSPDGHLLAVAGHNGVQVWDSASGESLALLLGYTDLITP